MRHKLSHQLNCCLIMSVLITVLILTFLAVTTILFNGYAGT